MSSNTRTFTAVGSILVVVILLVGHFLNSSSSRKQQEHAPAAKQVMLPAGVTIPTGMGMPNGMAMPKGMGMLPNMAISPALLEGVDQIEMYRLAAERHISARAAVYLMKSKIQMVDESKTSMHFLMTFPDGVTINETISLRPNQTYTPTSADLERATRGRKSVYDPRLSVEKKGADSMQATLEYAVPYSALPKEVHNRIGAVSAQPSAEFFTLVTPAWGQARSVVEPSLAVVANVLAEHWKGIDALGEEFETFKSLGIDAPLAIFDLILSMGELNGQLNEIGSLQDCATNPTNPLTQKASHDPNYQHDVLDPLSEARFDVGSSGLPRVANVAAGYLTHFLPFGFGAALAPILGMNDDAINSINEQRIKDAEKLVVECEKEKEEPAFGFRPMAGKFEYKYNDSHRNCSQSGSESGCNFGTTVRQENGTFVIDPDATEESADAANRGSGFAKDDGGFETPKCRGETHSTISGPLKVSVEAMGTPESAILRLTAGSGEWKGTLDSSDNCSAQSKPVHQTWDNGGAPGVDCKFTHVDMTKGGHYATFSEAEHGRGTCTIDLERK
jgi:hypothetical protein